VVQEAQQFPTDRAVPEHLILQELTVNVPAKQWWPEVEQPWQLAPIRE
jgi:hypothetical protein